MSDLRDALRAVRATPLVSAAAILSLAEEPRPHGARALQGRLCGYLRIRVGDYRVVYEVRDAELVVLVVRIGQRGDVYE